MFVGAAAAAEAVVAAEAAVPVVIDPVAVVPVAADAADESAEERLAAPEVIVIDIEVAVPVAAAVVEDAEPVATHVAAVGRVVTP